MAADSSGGRLGPWTVCSCSPDEAPVGRRARLEYRAGRGAGRPM